ncbi:MAG: hypothetical protein WDW38_010647 [Sanguina aurantia]
MNPPSDREMDPGTRERLARLRALMTQMSTGAASLGGSYGSIWGRSPPPPPPPPPPPSPPPTNGNGRRPTPQNGAMNGSVNGPTQQQQQRPTTQPTTNASSIADIFSSVLGFSVSGPPPPPRFSPDPRRGPSSTRGQAPPRPLQPVSDWDSDYTEDWDPEEGMTNDDMQEEASRGASNFRQETPINTMRDNWLTPLLDWQSIVGAFDPDQERSEQNLTGEALANKEESQVALRYTARIVILPLVAGFLISRSLADPILHYSLQNNPAAFAMTDRQKVEGAQKVHVEMNRLRMDMAIGRAPPLNESQLHHHLEEFAEEVLVEEREHNEQSLITVISDSVSSLVLLLLLTQQADGREALRNTTARLFDGLSNIAKAVAIILVADTLLGYHSEEGWTGFIELVLGHYGIEAEEPYVVIFVSIVPVTMDCLLKYWLFVGLNKTSPGAVVTIKAIDRH